MKVNMLEAKSQLSKLVKAALEGEEVLIARDGEPVVRLVPLTAKRGLSGWGKLKSLRAKIDAGFEADVETAVARSLERRK